MNITTAVFRPGAKRITLADSLVQWDYGQWIQIEGLDLPDSFEVDFSTDPYDGYAEPAIGTDNLVRIPDSLLEIGETIYAFVFLHQGDDDGETKYRITIPIEKRTARGTADPDDVEQSVITQTIAALNAAVANAETAAADAAAARDAITDMNVDAISSGRGGRISVSKEVDDATGRVTLMFELPEGSMDDPVVSGAVYVPHIQNGILNWELSDSGIPVDGYNIVEEVLNALPYAEGDRF